MSDDTVGVSYAHQLQALVESQGTTLYVSLALDELGLTKIQEVTHRDHFVRRCVALREESK